MEEKEREEKGKQGCCGYTYGWYERVFEQVSPSPGKAKIAKGRKTIGGTIGSDDSDANSHSTPEKAATPCTFQVPDRNIKFIETLAAQSRLEISVLVMPGLLGLTISELFQNSRIFVVPKLESSSSH
ncbi:hypothetical protein K0M31_003486 [Melipona bicolor]|uniref:Uncharacterized protein n=1 Tax=Melipona bicolor TaxID=60889 RepID=A0AA40FZ37_9HYME|nr:hypothetical protein K0M31_003486 [Melipona bicolor]